MGDIVIEPGLGEAAALAGRLKPFLA